MMNLLEKICLVVPCYNEEKRLDIEKFKAFGEGCYFLFANDGSKDNTLDLLKNNQKENMFILNLEKNCGKAEAVRQAMLQIKTLPVYEEIVWVGFWDADLSTPLDELNNFIIFQKTFYKDADAVWGSRVKRLGSNISRSPKRHYLGRIFATFGNTALKLKCYDSQCGAKLFKKELIDAAFSEAFISRWIFDIEILLRLKKFNIIEYPLYEWKDVSGSKVRIFRVALRTMIEILIMRKKYLCSKCKQA